jgi:surfeit locus 1 family protein
MATADAVRSPKPFLRQLLWPTLFTLISGAILIGLGVWQLHRLAWKEGLLAEIAARADAAPTDVPPVAGWAGLKPVDYDYRRVKLTGRYLYQDTVTLFDPGGPKHTGPGYLFLTPLKLASSGAYVIVNRGFVPADLAPKLRSEAGPDTDVEVTGLMRPPEPRGLFTPADHPEKGEYFTSDPALIGTHFKLAPVAPFTIDADVVPGSSAWPIGGTTVRDIPNNHFGYALTWFGLAAGLAGVFVAFVTRKYRDTRGTGPASVR